MLVALYRQIIQTKICYNSTLRVATQCKGIMEFKGKIAKKLAWILYLYFETINKIFGWSLKLKASSKGVSLSFENSLIYNETLDKRIEKIDAARFNLLEGLRAIDELKISAKENKSELEATLIKLKILENNRLIAKNELEQVKHIASTDIDTFKKMAGVQTIKDIKKERIIGFISGIFASFIATVAIISIKHVIK